MGGGGGGLPCGDEDVCLSVCLRSSSACHLDGGGGVRRGGGEGGQLPGDIYILSLSGRPFPA